MRIYRNEQSPNTPNYVWKNIILPFNSLNVGQTWVKDEMQFIMDFVDGDRHNLSEHVQGAITDKNTRFGQIDDDDVNLTKFSVTICWGVMNFFFRSAGAFVMENLAAAVTPKLETRVLWTGGGVRLTGEVDSNLN